MLEKTERKDIMRTVITIWLFATTTFTAYVVWNEYKNKQLVQAYQNGRVEALQEVFKSIQKSACQPVPVSIGEQSFSIADAGCLNQQKNVE